MINPVSSSAATAAAPSPVSSTNTASGTNAPATQQMFLQLLVAQLKNQDPTQPQDGTQFVAQLAQFTQLEQTIAIRQDADTLVSAQTAAAAAYSSQSTQGASKAGN
jgi:flagellar basal-body rod modification protein FlgD